MKRGTCRGSGRGGRNEKGVQGGWAGYVSLMVGRVQEIEVASGTQEEVSCYPDGPGCWKMSSSTQKCTSRPLWEASSTTRQEKGAEGAEAEEVRDSDQGSRQAERSWKGRAVGAVRSGSNHRGAPSQI